MSTDRVERVKFNIFVKSVYILNAICMNFFILSVFTNVFDYANIGIGENNDNQTT